MENNNDFDAELDSAFSDWEEPEISPEQTEKVIDTYNKIRPKVTETWNEVKRHVKESGASSEAFGEMANKHGYEPDNDEAEEFVRNIAHYASIINEEENE